MASRMKEDEKNEKIIRGLLKLPANRKCINCSSLGPQYVCTNFWTFICTNCSGLHREFTHRVKSISMAKFSSQEVRALQEGGNERARDIYFKEWDPQRHSIPDSSNLDRLRDFIKHVYVERRYTGDRRSTDKPPRVKGEGEESIPYRSASRSPPYEDTFERRYGDRPHSGGRNEGRNFRYSDGERSPGSDPGDYRRSPGRFEVVDDRHRDDRHGIGNPDRRADDRTAADRTPKPEVLSPDSQKGMNASSPPLARSVRDILGDGGAPPRIEPPKSNGTRAPDSATQRQSTSSLTSLGSSNRSSAEFQQASTGSLIDFTTEPEPPVPVVPNQPTNQQTATGPTDQNWASFDVSAQQKASQITKSVSSLESALADLSTPISAPASNFTTFPGAGVYSLPAVNSGGQFPTTQQQVFSLFHTAGGQATSATSSVPLNGTPNIEGPLAAPTAQSSQATRNPPQQSNTVASQASVNPKISGRKELPEDLFTALYSLAPAPVQAWQVGAQTGIGYGMQYPAAVNAFPHSSKSMNPFDLVNDMNPVHASQFPSMASLRGALPTMNHPSSLTRTGSLEAPAQRWMSTQQPSYPSAFSTSPYMVPQQDQSMQQVHNNMFPMGHQGVGGFGGQGAAFGPLGVDQLSAVRNPLPGTPNAFAPVGGNPFG